MNTAVSTVRLAGKLLRHPLDFYEELSAEGRAKIWAAIAIVVLAVAARLLSLRLTGFAYQTVEPHRISYVIQTVWIVVPWLTWAVANWGVSTIVSGEGKFIDVLSGSAFVLVPYIVLSVPISLLTLFITLDERSIFLTLTWFMYGWVGFLVLMKIKLVHDFELGKAVWIAVLTVVGMAVIWLVGLMVFGLVNQLIQYVVGLVKEMSFRL